MRFRILITGWVALAMGVAVFPSDARAEPFCKQYNISSASDRARLNQSNNWEVHFDFAQSESRLYGRARGFQGYRYNAAAGQYEPIFRDGGLVKGNVYPSDPTTGVAIVSFTITWDDGPIGAYRGTIRNGLTVDQKRTGFLSSGSTWDLRHPQSKATWDVVRTGKDATCAYNHPPGPPGPA
jgi:hypothetical protein